MLPVIVMDELARFALVIPAEPERLAFVKPVIVLEPAAIVLFVNVSVVFLPTNVSVALGSVSVLFPPVTAHVSVPVVPAPVPSDSWLDEAVRDKEANDGVAVISMFWIVFTTPDDAVKLVALNVAIPFVDPSA